MHIGVVPDSKPSHGGAHQYSLAILDALAAVSAVTRDNEYTLLLRSERQQEYCGGIVGNWDETRLPLSTRERLVDLAVTTVGNGWLREAVRRAAHLLVPRMLVNVERIPRNETVNRFLKQLGIDWILYTRPTAHSFESGVPYVMPVFDLQHRLQPEFPEVSAHGEWERREYLYRNGTRNAVLILADSEIGREDILQYYGPYGITPDRVKVLPFLPAPYLSREVPASERARVRAAYRLPKRYLLYPAQLWPHKNHVRIVQALGQLRTANHPDVHLVLCGTHSGANRTRVYREMMHQAQRLGVVEQVHYLGYVPNAAMSSLYAEAEGLVMPTFFGPTNIPIVEAWLFGCPVLASDVRGIREQVGDAGLLVEPRSVEAIADGMKRLWNDAGLRAELAQRGTARLARYSRHDFCGCLAEIIAEASQRVGDLRAGRTRASYRHANPRDGAAASS